MGSTHSHRLERWLGAEQVEAISRQMRGWYGPPIALAGVPGRVYACGDGDFCGPLHGGYFGNLVDYAVGRGKRILREAARRSSRKVCMGFSSLSDLISEATIGGKKQVVNYVKTGVAAPAVNASQGLWRLGANPQAGANAAAPPGGTIFTNASTGSFKQTDAAGGDTLHFVSWLGMQTTTQTSPLMLVDYLWAANFDYNTTANQAVTGVPTRYQTAGTAPGNFISGNVTTTLGATPSNLTLTYVDQDGNAAEAGAAQAVRISSAVDTAPFTQPQWFYNLNAPDTGLRKLTNFVLSAAMSGGFVDRMICHPIAIMPGVGVGAQMFLVDGINSAFNLERIYDGACLMFFEWMRSATAASTYAGQITLVSG